MTTRQLKNKLVRILGLSPEEITVSVGAYGCYLAQTLNETLFPSLFINYIKNNWLNNSSVVNNRYIILLPEIWKIMLNEIVDINLPFEEEHNSQIIPEGAIPPQSGRNVEQQTMTYRDIQRSLGTQINEIPTIQFNSPPEISSFTTLTYDEDRFINPFSSVMLSGSRRRIGRPAIWSKCIKCSTKTKIIDLIPITEAKYTCSDCFVSLTECENCKRYLMDNDKITATNEKNYCNNCFSQIGFMCTKDRQYYADKKYVITTFGQFFCRVCRDKYLTRCNSCAGWEETNHFTICSVCDKAICRNCEELHQSNCYFRELTEIKFIDGKKENSILPFNRYVGVEIEAERGEIKGLLKDLEKEVGLTRDGSLEDRGVEVQTPPATFDALENIIKKTTKVLKNHGYKGTIHCGLHLHFDARDIMNDHKKIIQVIKTFYAVEDIIYSMLPPSRWGTHYCQQLNKNYLYKNFKKQLKKNDIEKEIYKETNMRNIEQRKNHKYDAVRYYGLNIHSIFFRHTIELRYHSGTIEDYKIINWINIASRIIDYAINHYNEKEIEAMFNLATSHDKFKAFCNLFKLSSDLINYMDKRLQKFNPNYKILFNKGREARELERKDIAKKTKVIDKTIAKLYPQAYKDVGNDFEYEQPSPRNLKIYALERARELARKELSKEYFNLPLDGGFIKDEELENIRIFMEQGRQLSQGAEGADEAEM
ncbi:amidoligase family protein [Candidatus Dojkabacteria bacterium]|jgi:hypothetical protein|nr:amidoligase family protein [Candidatus Dojkabacteria bacterium]